MLSTVQRSMNAKVLEEGSKYLDFGDCYAGVASTRLLKLRNVTDDTLYVSFKTEFSEEVS